MSGIWHYAAAAWSAQRGHLFPWVPVALACGIGLYFSAGREPEPRHYLFVVFSGLALMLLAGRADWRVSPLLWAAVLSMAGFCLAGLRAHQVEAPVIGWRYYGPVEGRIAGIDRSASDAVRLTLDRVVLQGVAPERIPDKVRVALHGQQGFVRPEPGISVMMTAHLAPPGGPVEPGGFDFRRHAWFKGLGAVGYTRTPVLALERPEQGLWLFRVRMAFADRIRDTLKGETGAVAAAIMTGDRSGIGEGTLRALRVSNLAHLLAISGLHMGLVAGFVFAALRLVLAAIPSVGLRVPAKKIAALVALAAAAGYLALSGGNVATERAFVMVAVALGAVLTDRRALSLRAVAVAAVILLVLRPEALFGPGFQMSFAATTALVAVFGWLRGRNLPSAYRWMRPVAAVVLSSSVAGAATAPFAAAHFNQVAHYGLIANLLSVPLMGLLVMPAAVVAACLLPFGLDWIALWAMRPGLDWILGVADRVASLDGARGAVVAPGGWVLPLLALGCLVLVLWQGRGRMAGLPLIIAAFLLWSETDRPDILIADSGALVGVMTDKGRALSARRGAGFIASNWLENDGDPSDQETAHERWPPNGVHDLPVIAVKDRRAASALLDCAPGQIVVMNVSPPHPLPCTVLHPAALRETGAIALYETANGFLKVTARSVTGRRLWNTPKDQ